jgi:hypothetical protein
VSELLSSHFDRWIRGTGIVAVVALAWAVFVPGGLFWTAVLAAGLIGTAVVTAVVVRRRSVPSLAQVIASAEAEPAVVPAHRGDTSGAGLRPRGERKP